MSRRLRTNLALLVSASLLGLLMYVAPGTDRGSRPPPLTGMVPEQIHRIEILRRDHPPVLLEKKAGRWHMIAPHAVPANEPRIQTLARIAVTPVFQTLAAPTGRLAEFGLAPPGVRLRLNDLLLELGTTDPIHFMRYVLLEGELRLINDGFQHHLLAPAEAFVSHQPLAGERPIDRLVWQDRERRVTDVDAWTRLAAKKVEVAVPPYAGRTLTFHYGSGEGDRVFLVPEDHEGLLVRPDLGLAYRLADAGALRDLLGSGADPH